MRTEGGIVPEHPPRKVLDLDSVLQVLHQQIDLADEAKSLAVPVHRTFAYDLLHHLYRLKDAIREAKQ